MGIGLILVERGEQICLGQTGELRRIRWRTILMAVPIPII